MKWLWKRFKGNQMPEWRKHPNPYLQLHLLVYPKYLEELDAGTYEPIKDPFLSIEYILSHPFESFGDVERELRKHKELDDTRNSHSS